LRGGGVGVAQPRPSHARPPPADNVREALVLARFGAERFYYGVSG
jgi:hypothetical protein